MKISSKFNAALICGCMLFSVGTAAAQDSKKMPPPPMVEVSNVIAVKEGYSRKYPAQMVSVRDVALPARVSGKIEYIIRKCADCGTAFKLGDRQCTSCGKGTIEKGITMEGQFVKKGDLLIKLEDTTYVAARDAAKAQQEQAKAQIEQAKAQMEQAVAQAEQAKAQDLQADAQIEQANAQIKQAEAALKYAQENYEREDNLRKVSAKKELDAAIRDRDQALAVMAAAKGQLASANAAKAQAKAAMSAAKATKASADAAKAAAEAQLAAANAALTDAENNLSYTRIYADFDGKIGKVAFSVGNYVTPNSGALAQLTQFDPIYVTFSISEQDYLTVYGSIDKLVKDAVVRVRLSNDEMYPEIAPVWIVDNKIDSQTGTIKIWARLNNGELDLTPGGLVEAHLSKKVETEFPAVPVSSIQISRQGQFVWIVEADNSVRQQPVEAGSTLGNLRVITKGLTVGQTVVSAGAHKIIPIPGAKIMVTPVPRAAKK